MFERLCEETGCRTVIGELVGTRKHGFALERAVFLTVLHLGRRITARGASGSWSDIAAGLESLTETEIDQDSGRRRRTPAAIVDQL